MARVRAIPASPRVPRITRLRRQLIRRELDRQSSDEIGQLLNQPARGIPAELAEPTRPLADMKPRPYELQPESIAIIALLCTIAGFLIGYIVHAKVIA